MMRLQQIFMTFGAKKIMLVVMALILVIGVVATVVLLQQRQDNRSRASSSNAVRIYTKLPDISNQVPNTPFTTELYIDTGPNDVSAIDITLTSSDPNALKIIGFTPAPPESSPYLSTVVLNKVDANGATFRYIVINKSLNAVSASPNLLLGTLQLQTTGVGTATLTMGTASKVAAAQGDNTTGADLANLSDPTLNKITTVVVANAATATSAPTNYICTYSEATISNALGSNNMPAGTPFEYAVKFKVNSTSAQITDFNQLLEDSAKVSVAPTCRVIQASLNGTDSLHECKWNLTASQTIGTHNLSFSLRYADNNGTALPDRTLCTVDSGSGTKQASYTTIAAPTLALNPPTITPAPSWTGPAVSYVLSPQNPTAGAVTVKIYGRTDANVNIALLVDNVPKWATGGGGEDGTEWALSLPAGTHTIQLVGNCDYGSADPGGGGGPNCSGTIARFNEASIVVSP